MPAQLIFFAATIVLTGLLAVAMHYSIKKHNARMASMKKKRLRK